MATQSISRTVRTSDRTPRSAFSAASLHVISGTRMGGVPVTMRDATGTTHQATQWPLVAVPELGSGVVVLVKSVGQTSTVCGVELLDSDVGSVNLASVRRSGARVGATHVQFIAADTPTDTPIVGTDDVRQLVWSMRAANGIPLTGSRHDLAHSTQAVS
ncbi:MAG: hypothetical protein AAFQ42_04735 [Pseudomonadota bacterium]